MNEPPNDDAEAEKKRQKKRKMTKILIKAWNLDPNPFLHSDELTASDKEYHNEGPMDLSSMGEMLDADKYSSDSKDWERFALDLAWIYRRFLISGKHSQVGQQHLEEIQNMFAHVDPRLSTIVQEVQSGTTVASTKRKKRAVNTQIQSPEIQESPKKKGRGPQGKKKAKVQREVKAEISKLQKELDKAIKARDKASKALETFLNETQEELNALDEDTVLGDDDNLNQGPNPRLVLGNYDTDILQQLPAQCAPDVLMVWDFLVTFSKSLSLEPIQLNDFVKALLYAPPIGKDHDVEQRPSPPIFMAEAHMALLKLILSDSSSDDWWRIMDDTLTLLGQSAEGAIPSLNELQYSNPLIKVDVISLLSVSEDPITTDQWLTLLNNILGNKKISTNRLKNTLKRVASITRNKFVIFYLFKCFQKRKILSDSTMKDAIGWLVTLIRQARIDLLDHQINKDTLMEHIRKVGNEAMALMDHLQADDEEEDVDMEVLDDTYFDESEEESESEDEFDSDQDEDYQEPNDQTLRDSVNSNGESSTLVTSSVPELPSRTLVDILLPSNKHRVKSDVLSAFTWPALAGITARRFLHRLKWLRNEVDDSLRAFREKPKMTVAERRRRESIASFRILPETVSVGDASDPNPLESAISHLCESKPYLDLRPVQRLCILRLLIEVSYDTNHIYNCIQDNVKSRTTAEKSLELEERQAKKEAKEEATHTEEVARTRLLNDAKRRFIERKRQELERNPKRKRGYSEDQIRNLTDEEICSIDENTKTEFQALDSMIFSKSEMSSMISKINDENAFGKKSVEVLSLEEIQKREEKDLAGMLDELSSYGTVDVFDRNISAKVDKLRKEITNFQEWMVTLPRMRSEAIVSLRDAIQDGTMKVLKSAIRVAKDALLMGDANNGESVWALDLLRDAFLELKAAERRKRVIDAQKDLVGKRNKCFVRTEPIGFDRFHSKYWHFDHDGAGRLWVECDFEFNIEANNPNTSELLATETETAMIGPMDEEEDLLSNEMKDADNRSKFLRQEFHRSGLMNKLAKRNCGFYTAENSLRSLIKNMDGRRKREAALKEELKKILESSGAASSSNFDTMTQSSEALNFPQNEDTPAFLEAKEKFISSFMSSDDSIKDYLKSLSSALGQEISLPQNLLASADSEDTNFITVKVTGWEMKRDENHSFEVPTWKVTGDADVGADISISSIDLFEGLARVAHRSDRSQGDFSSLLDYRNKMGKFCGRAIDAPFCMSVFNLSKLLLKREQDLYPSLKCRLSGTDNHWGGKNGLKNAWILSLKDYGDRFETVKDCCLLLEAAFFEFCGGVSMNHSDENDSATLQLLNDAKSRLSVSLETKGPKVTGLWANSESRLIFRDILSSCTNVITLALCIELLCANCQHYLEMTKSNIRQSQESYIYPTDSMRMTRSSINFQNVHQPNTQRRMNAWQQQQSY